MNILHTEASTGWGGQDIRVLSECVEMQKRGHKVVLACAAGCPLWKAAQGKVTLAPLAFGRKLKWNAVREVRRLIRVHNIGVVNTHSSADGWSGAVAAKLSRVPCVRTRHLSNPLKKNRANYLLYTRLTDFVVTTGDQLKDTLVSHNGLHPARIVSIPTGVDISRFDPAACDRAAFRHELGLTDDDFLWTIVAIIRRMKGHSVLVQAAALLKESHPHAHFAVVGGVTGPSPLPDELEKRVEELGLAGRFHFVGMRDDIPNILAGADGFVLPSQWGEGVPQSVAQAQAMGLPVVSTDVGSIPELVRDGETGLLVPAGNVEALAAAMRRVVDDPALAQKLAAGGQTLVREQYSQDAMIERMEAVYLQVLKC